MAQRRMFSKKITDTDQFLDMPLSAQALYFHLNMHADDDGFVDNVKTLKRMVGSSEDDLKLLLTKQFIIVFEDGVTVIKDWRVHNYIQRDRYNPTRYAEHKRELKVGENKSYQRLEPMDTKCIHDVHETETQVRLGKVRLGKDRVSKEQTNYGELENDLEEKPSVGQSVKKYCDKIVDFFQFKCNFGGFSPVLYQDLDQDFSDWLKLNDDPEEVTNIFCLALKETASVRNVRKPYQYAQGILDNWERDKHTTLAAVKADLSNQDKPSTGKDYNYRKRTVVQKEQLPEWAEKDYHAPEESTEEQEHKAQLQAEIKRRLAEIKADKDGEQNVAKS